MMLKNTQEAKFNRRWSLSQESCSIRRNDLEIAFDSFFTHILAHELMHGIGPHSIKVAAKTTVRLELKELASAIEEAKADITGLWGLQYLIDKGPVDKKLENARCTRPFSPALSAPFVSASPKLTAKASGDAIQLSAG